MGCISSKVADESMESMKQTDNSRKVRRTSINRYDLYKGKKEDKNTTYL